MAQSIREQLGYGKERIVELKPLDDKAFKVSIERLNKLPITTIQKLISPRIIDFQAEVTKVRKSKCNSGFDDCKMMEATFKFMFAYDIIGFRFSHGQKFSVNGRRWNDYSNRMYPSSQYFGRKGGYMVTELVYKHHLNGHQTKDTPFQFKHVRTPFALAIPNIQEHLYDGSRGGMYLMNKEIIDTLFDFRRDYEPTLANHDLFLKDHNLYKYHRVHSICQNQETCSGRSECGLYHDEKAFCKNKCQPIVILNQFQTHPHFFFGSGGFCSGNNTYGNITFKEADNNRNPISFIKALIHSFNYVTQNDCQGSFEFFTDVFFNSKLIFDNKFMRLLDSTLYRLPMIFSEKGLNSEFVDDLKSEDHQFSLECYCFSCLSMRGAIQYGLMIDFDKLIQDDSILITVEQIQKQLIKELTKGKLKDYDEHLLQQFNSNRYEEINGKKYYKISEVLIELVDMEIKKENIMLKQSPLDFRNSLSEYVEHSTMSRFVDSTTGKLITFNTVGKYKDEVTRIRNSLNNMLINSNDIFISAMNNENSDEIIEMLSKIELKNNISEKSFTPYLIPLSEDEIKKVEEALIKHPPKRQDNERFR